MEKKSQNADKNKSEKSDNSKDEQTVEKTGYEASDIIEDALQLAVDDELKDDREDMNNESGHSSKVNINSSHNEVKSQKYTEDSTPEQMKAMLSPPRPETAPVVAPLTIEDKISMDTSKLRNCGTDDASMIVNLDDTNTDLLDTDVDSSLNASESNDIKTNRKSNSDSNCADSKSLSINENKNSSNEEINLSTKDMNKVSEKDSSKAKSSNQRESKVKSKESKNGTLSQKGPNNSKNNIWVSGLSQNTKASELQTIFSKHGKVVSAKIIKNARMSGSRCFGFITMESSEQVLKCIAQLNKSELHGKTIALSRNRPQESASKPVVTRSKPNSLKKDINKNTKETEVKETKNEEKSDESKAKKPSEERHTNRSISESGSNKGSETKADKRKPIRAPLRDRPLFPRKPMIPFKRPIPFRRPFAPNSFRGFHKPGFGRGGIRPTFATFPIKRQDIDRNIRERERERRIREERRRREELLRVDIEREERIRFEREKERLKLERMKLEREKAEFFKFERERAKLEREKIEREREELLRRRQQTQPVIQHRVEESRSRSAMVTSSLGKRPFESREMRSNDPYWEERKRVQNIQRIDTHLIPGRQNLVESSSSVGNRHSIPHSYENRNDSYKRNTRIDFPMTGNSRPEFDSRRHDSRHTIGHDRDDRKNSGIPSYYRGGETSRNTFTPRDRRFGASQREDWKSGHDSRRSDRYSDKAMSGGSNSGFAVSSRYGSDSRGWNDRSSNSVNKVSYGGSNIHMSGSQGWTPSMSGRWNSAINSSSESRSRGQSSHTTSMLSGANPSITELFGSAPMSGIGLNISHSMGGNAGNSLGSGDRTFIHRNRF